MFDVCIIGAGIVGTAIARELSKYDLKICLLEKNEDVGAETTKANSGIVHGGYSAKHGSLKAAMCAKGNHLYRQLNDELHFGFKETGSFVIGFDEDDAERIKALYENGLKNGAIGLKIVDGDFVREREPHLNKDISVALFCESTGITSPFEFAVALAENAIQNGVALHLNTEVYDIEKQDEHFKVFIRNDKPYIEAKRVINAAGLYSDEIAQMVGLHEFTIEPKRGEYLLFDKHEGYRVNSVIFQTPTPNSKGVLVTKTYHGNLMIGPNANVVRGKDDLETSRENIDFIVEMAKKSLPEFDMGQVITSFAGNRATPSTGDFIIEETKVKGFINAAGIESPGLTSAPAIAVRIKEIVEESGINLKPKQDFNPHRKPYHVIADMDEEELNELIKKEPAYGRVVCRCETVSEGEIVDAIRRPIPIRSMDAIKRRTRAGMGRCQAGFCTPKILEVMYNELNEPIESFSKKNKGSEIVIGRTKRSLMKKNDSK